MESRPTLALIVAGGRGSRAGEGFPKQYRPLGGMPVLRRTALAFLDHPDVDLVRIVIHPDDEALYLEAVGDLDLPAPISGGETRQASVANGLAASLADAPGGLVLIHDAARPFVPASLIARCIEAARRDGAAVPVLAVHESLRRGGGILAEEVDRTGLNRVQTPQCFDLAAVEALHRELADAGPFTDDAAIAMRGGMTVATVEGDEANIKLTTEADFARAEARLVARMVSRTGLGFDVHAFAAGDSLWLSGIRIPHSRGLSGHSDADVALHAVTDALLGAIGEGDIGDHFPPGDPKWRGAPSSGFVEHARSLIERRGGRIDHVDVTIICEAPKIGPHRLAMRQSLAALLRLPPGRISIKATTTERLGFAGRGEGIAAMAAATVRLPEEI